MKNKINNIEELIIAAKAGNKTAEAKFFSKLTVRFSALVKRELQGNPILIKRVNTEEKSLEVCQNAIAEVKRLYPLSSTKWSLRRAVNVLHNIVDDFITNSLTDFAKNGDAEAENLLFIIIRKKLMERIAIKGWGASQYEREN